MSATVLPVWPGYPFALPLVYAVPLPAGALLRIDLSPTGQSRAEPIEVILTSPSPTNFLLSLTAEQTAPLRAPGALVGDLVLRYPDGSEAPLNARLTLPVEACLTAPEA